MLGAAMEGSWIELGESLVQAAGKANTGGPGKKIQDELSSIKSKIDAVCALYKRQDLYGNLYKTTGIKPSLLEDVAAWSHLVRDARNVLHWKARAKPKNSYTKVATLLMAALDHLGKLHRLRDAAAPKRNPRRKANV
jgi:hypothetical protein